MKSLLRQLYGSIHLGLSKLKYGESKYIIILSHMRGYTSLISHILGSNPDISGYKENHISYVEKSDLLDMRWVLLRDEFKNILPKKYLLDKVLHNHIDISEDVLLDESVYKVFLIRRPEGALKSMVNMLDNWDENMSLEYYSSRLGQLESYARICQGRDDAILISADDIISDTAKVFEGLEKFLKLENPLSEDYDLFKSSGKSVSGDSSKYIKSGKIDRGRKKINVNISDEVLLMAGQAFDECIREIKSSIRSI